MAASGVVFRRVRGRIVPIRASAVQARSDQAKIDRGARSGALKGLGVGLAAGAVVAASVTPQGRAAVRKFVGASQTAGQVGLLKILRPVHLSVVGAPPLSLARRIGIRTKLASRIMSTSIHKPGLAKIADRSILYGLYGAAIGSSVGASHAYNQVVNSKRPKARR